MEDKDDTLLFYNTNEYRVIKCLIGNPYLKNERLSFNRKGFYLENFIDNIEIPILLNEKIENNKVEMIGEIDTLLLAEVTFIKKLKENNKLDNFIKNIINKKNIYYKDFHYHISDGPILENSVRIKGIDNRINTLKIDLVKEFIKDEHYQYYINQVKSMIKNNSNYELPLINDEQTQEIKEYYE